MEHCAENCRSVDSILWLLMFPISGKSDFCCWSGKWYFLLPNPKFCLRFDDSASVSEGLPPQAPVVMHIFPFSKILLKTYLSRVKQMEYFLMWLWNSCQFLQRAQCSRCKRCISYSNSVRPSVRPSHAGILSKRRHVARYSLHRWIAKCV